MGILDNIRKSQEKPEPKVKTTIEIKGSDNLEEKRAQFVPEHEKPISPYFFEKPTIKYSDQVQTADEFHAWFRAFASKFPHFDYLCTTKCSWSKNKKQFWFRDTQRLVCVVLTAEEIDKKLKGSK